VPAFDIENNEFGPLGNKGAVAVGGVTVDRVGNNFHDISSPSVASWLGIGQQATSSFVYPPAMPVLKCVRGNVDAANAKVGTTPACPASRPAGP
jgi:hypothetical protein